MAKPRLKRSTMKERANELRRLEQLPPNPVRTIRQDLELSHQSLATSMRVTKQALIRTEQGCFEEIPPAILHFLVKLGHNELALRDAYEGYRQEMRKRNQNYFGPLVRFDVDPIIQHPFSVLCAHVGVNTTQVAKDLCLSQATLQHWLKHWKTQQSIPKPFISCLRDIGYREMEILQLQMWYERFRKEAKNAVK